MSEFRVPVLSIGDKVVVEGLVSASNHNGKSGTVVGYLLDSNWYDLKLKLKLKLSDDDYDDGGGSSNQIPRSQENQYAYINSRRTRRMG